MQNMQVHFDNLLVNVVEFVSRTIAWKGTEDTEERGILTLELSM